MEPGSGRKKDPLHPERTCSQARCKVMVKLYRIDFYAGKENYSVSRDQKWLKTANIVPGVIRAGANRKVSV